MIVLISACSGKTFKVISLNTKRVPKEPVTSLDKSYPVTFFTTVPPSI